MITVILFPLFIVGVLAQRDNCKGVQCEETKPCHNGVIKKVGCCSICVPNAGRPQPVRPITVNFKNICEMELCESAGPCEDGYVDTTGCCPICVKRSGNEKLADRTLLCGVGRPSSCTELQLMGYTKSGVYTIYPRTWFNRLPFDVYCDMTTDGGGWTVFQRRNDYGEPRENFFRNWADYSQGFGNLSREFWLGNDNIFLLTNQDQVVLRIDLGDFEGNKTYALYKGFQVGHKDTDYRLINVGEYTGETPTVPGNTFMYLTPGAFVTYDRNDVNECAKTFKGGWWYTVCHRSNLNGPYLKGSHESYADGIEWAGWKGLHYSLKWTEMSVRPIYYSNESKARVVTPQ